MAAGNGLFSKSGWPFAGDGPPWAAPGVEGPPLLSSSRRIQVDHLVTDIFRKLITREGYIKKRQRRQSPRDCAISCVSYDLLRRGPGYFGHKYQPFRCLSNRGTSRIVVRKRTSMVVRYSDTIEPKSMPSTQVQSSTSSARAAAIEQSLRTIIRGNDEVLRLALVSVLAR